MKHMLANISFALQADGFCFGFVEFESEKTMNAAIEVCSPSVFSQFALLLYKLNLATLLHSVSVCATLS